MLKCCFAANQNACVICQKIREMELIDKKRTAELERLIEEDRKKQQTWPHPSYLWKCTAGAIVTLMYSMILVSLYNIIAMIVKYAIVHFHAFNFCLWKKWTWRFSGKVYCTCIINVLVHYIWYIFTNCFYILSVYFFKLKSMMVYHDINIWHLCACICRIYS